MTHTTHGATAVEAATPGAVADHDASAEGPRLGLVSLMALVVGSMIGAGIFSLPQNMAAGPASPGALAIGWLVTGVGMLAMARTFQYLGRHAEDAHGGLHGYARDGFGDLPGVLVAWGYWVSAWLGNLAYLVVMFSTLGLFVPMFGDGTTLPSTIGESVVLWLYTALLLRGVREANVVNMVVTAAKLIPLVVFLILAVGAFDAGVFTADLWGRQEGLGPVLEQVKAMMLVTVWAFLGIEGATVFARRARRREDVGTATVTGFALVLLLLVAVNLLSAGLMARADLEGLQNPSMAGVLESVVGRWGSVLIAIGLVVSVMGALLAWMLLCAEILSSTARAGAFPQRLGRERRPGVPRDAVILTSVVLQLALVWAHVAGAGYYDVILMAGSMMLVPYLASSVYALRLALRTRSGGALAVLTAAVSTLYAVWLLWAGGLDYLLATTLFYVLGLVVHAWARRERTEVVLRGGAEWALAVALFVGAMWAGSLLLGGRLLS